MVKRLFTFLQKEFSGLHEAAFLIGLSALASQLLGLWRDRLLAATFGTSQTLDIYYAGFRVPDILFPTIGSFVAVTVLIPFLIQRLKQGDDQATRQFLNEIFTVFCLTMIAVTVVLLILAPKLAPLVAPGFDRLAQQQLIAIMRILLLSPLLLGLSNLLGSITQSLKKFYVYALSPLLYNLGIIGGVIFGYPRFGLPGLAAGVVLGALLHLAIQLPIIWSVGLLPRPTRRFNWPGIKAVIGLSLPRTLTLAAHQIVFTIFVAAASLLETGSISVFNFAFNIQSVPLTIIGISYSVAAFPTLAQLFSQGEVKPFTDYVAVGMRQIIFWSLPATGLFIVLRAQIVRVVLGAGHFDWAATRLVAAALALFVASVTAQSLTHLFVRGYYAGGHTRKPLMINLLASATMVILGLVLIPLFKHWPMWRFFFESLLRVEDVGRTVILMLPLAFSLGAVVNMLLHWFWFERDFSPFPRAVSQTFFQALAAAVASGVVAYGGLQILSRFLDLDTFIGIFSQGLLAGLLGIIAGIALLKLLGSQELAVFSQTLHKKFWRARTVAPEIEEL